MNLTSVDSAKFPLCLVFWVWCRNKDQRPAWLRKWQQAWIPLTEWGFIELLSAAKPLFKRSEQTTETNKWCFGVHAINTFFNLLTSLWPVNMTEDHFKPCELRKNTVKQLKPGLCEISDSNNISFRSVICICVWLGLILKIPKQTKFRQHFQINNISVKEKNKE